MEWKDAMKVNIIYGTIDANKESLFLRVYENTMETQPCAISLWIATGSTAVPNTESKLIII